MKKINSVLIVDDDPIHNYLCNFLIKKLEMTDNIIIAKNGLKAIELLQDYSNQNLECPELIFLDILMPVMDGYEFLTVFDKMKIKNSNNIKIAILTSSCNIQDS
jgi:CheY-like chemotaxis protein